MVKKKKRKWCTAKIASKIKNKTKCKKRGCEWGYNYKKKRNTKNKGKKNGKCKKVSFTKRVLPDAFRDLRSKKKYCNKYRTGPDSIDKRACNRDSECNVYLSQLGWACGKIKKVKQSKTRKKRR